MLTPIQSIKICAASSSNIFDVYAANLETLYLTGNPCTDFKGYREYVIATLLQLKNLDGKEIERSERIIAMQTYSDVQKTILYQQETYKAKRLLQKDHARKQIEEEELQFSVASDKSEEEREREFWSKVSDHSPESRQHIAEHIQKQKENLTKTKSPTKMLKRNYKMFTSDGRPLNVNEAKIPFKLTEDDESNSYVLDIAVYRYLDTSLLDVDIQPTYIRVLIKGKIFQFVFSEEIKTECSTAKRSQTTGHLVLTLPKVNGEVKLRLEEKYNHIQNEEANPRSIYSNCTRRELLEIGTSDDMDFSKIVERNSKKSRQKASLQKCMPTPSSTDNPEVPPLE